MGKKKRRAKKDEFGKITIKAQVLNCIVTDPTLSLYGVMDATGFDKQQVKSAVIALRKQGAFPAGSGWESSRGRTSQGEPHPTVTQTEILTIANIGVEKTKEILRLLDKLKGKV